MGKTKVQVEDEQLSEDDAAQVQEESYSEEGKPKKKNAKKAQAKTPAASKKKEVEKKTTPKKTAPKKSSTKATKEKEQMGEEVKQNKKKDFLPGQKYPTPDDEDGALAFYKSLYEKNPRSQMARRYCLEYGVLEPQEATRLLKEMGKNKK